MKKNILALVLLVVSICAVAAYRQIEKNYSDNVPPTVVCETDTITVSVTTPVEEYLNGVTATDKVSGDVTGTIVIENISNFISENERIVTVAAIDASMNVGRTERKVIYTDYKEPTFNLSAPLSYVLGTRIDILANISADSVLDGDLTQKIRYGLDSLIDNLAAGEYPIEFRVTDSCGKTSYLNTYIEIYDSSYSGIDVSLSKYLVYVKKDAKFDASKYYKGSTIEGELTIVSDVNTKEPGTYHVDYYVNGINAAGKSRLVVVVE